MRLTAGPVTRHKPAAALIGLALAIATAAGVLTLRVPPPATAVLASPAPSATPVPVSSTVHPTTGPSSVPSASPSPEGNDLLGTDGRFTILLLGSDYRPAHPGNRTDTIMVVSVDPGSGAIAAASIPRDTSNFPLPGGGIYRAKVNGLYQSLIGKHGPAAGAQQMKRAVGSALGVEIDWYALVGFAGVRRLVDAVGGIDVVLDRAVRDPAYWVTSTRRGVSFPAGRNHLNGDRALIFARTRKGDNDFERARRQQLLVAGGLDAVRRRGLERLPALITAARGVVRTDLPLTLAPQIYSLVAGSRDVAAARVVFGPTKWASSLGGTSFALRLPAVRAWTQRWMAPVDLSAATGSGSAG